MKKMALLIAGIIIGTGVTMFNQNKNTQPKVEIKRIVTEAEDGIYIEEGDKFIELTDGSYMIINEYKQYYSFQPIEMNDWNYEVNNKEQLDDMVKIYINNKNKSR